MSTMSGLVNVSSCVSLPLRSSTVAATIKGVSARTTAMLTYYNDHREEIDAVFLMPLNHTWHVVEFELVAEGKYLFSELVASSEAEAVGQENNFQHDKESVFQISCGKISPWVIVEIQVTIICELRTKFFSDVLTYTLPQAFSPSVVPSMNVHQASTLSNAVSTLGYTFEIEVLIESPSLLHSVKSNSHPIRVDSLYPSSSSSKLRVTLPEDYERCNRTFELLIYLANPKEPFIVIEDALERATDQQPNESGNPISSIMSNPTIMLSYSPEYNLDQQDITESFHKHDPGDFVLMIDRSSTMDIKGVNTIREMCQLFLKSLPARSSFNIVGFGTYFENLFKECKLYSEKIVNEALAYIDHMTADMGGTALLEPLTWVLDRHDEKSRGPLHIFLLVFGHVTNPDDVIALVKARQNCARIFTFDMSGLESTLLDCLSALTNGQTCRISNSHRLQWQMIECLRNTLHPSITDLTASWILPDMFEVIYTPEVLPPIYPGNRVNLYALLATRAYSKAYQNDQLAASWNATQHWMESNELPKERKEEKESRSSTKSVLTNTLRTVSKLFTDSQSSNDTSKKIPTVNSSIEMENDVFYNDLESSNKEERVDITSERFLFEHVQLWRQARYRADSHDDQNKETVHQSRDQEKLQVHQPDKLRKSSSDCADSVGSIGSESSQLGHTSSLTFPGYTTRLGSCKSIEGRSPGISRHNTETQVGEGFFSSLPDESKSSVRSRKNSSHHSSSSLVLSYEDSGTATSKSSKIKGSKRVTKLLQEKSKSTHFIESANMKFVCDVLEDLVHEKRVKLREWCILQEEMTKCTWPSVTSEKTVEEGLVFRRDSGLGNRSSSEPQTSDQDDEIMAPLNTLGQFSKSSSGYFDTDDSLNRDSSELARKSKYKIGHESETRPLLESMHSKSLTETSSKLRLSQAAPRIKHASSVPASIMLRDESDDEQTTLLKDTEGKNQRKKSNKAKLLWTSFTEKIRNIALFINDQPKQKSQSSTSSIESSKTSKSPTKTSAWEKTSPLKLFVEDKEKRPESQSSAEGNGSGNTITEVNDGVSKMEISKTITSKKIYELREYDLQNLGESSRNAAICLSGRIGQNYFERLIPFKLVFEEEQSFGDITVHQLAAKSIITDLEKQIEADNPMTITSKDYLKKVIADVSKCTHVTSRFTSVVLSDECGNTNAVASNCTPNRKEKRDKSLWKSLPSRLPFGQVSSHETGSGTTSFDSDPGRLEKEHRPDNEQSTSQSVRPRFKSNSGTESTLPAYSAWKGPAPRVTGYMHIVHLNTAEGYWELTSALCEILKVPVSDLVGKCPFNVREKRKERLTSSMPSLSKDVENLSINFWRWQQEPDDVMACIWATIAALLYLHYNHQDFSSEWQLVHKKAYQWLASQTLHDGWTLDDIIRFAEKRLFSPTQNRRESLRDTNV